VTPADFRVREEFDPTQMVGKTSGDVVWVSGGHRRVDLYRYFRDEAVRDAVSDSAKKPNPATVEN